MLLRHPDIYVQATMNNLYGYFYPGGFTTKLYSYDKSETHLEELNESLADDGVSFHYPAAFDAVRQNLETLRESIFQLPGLVLLYSNLYLDADSGVLLLYPQKESKRPPAPYSIDDCITCLHRRSYLWMVFPLRIFHCILPAGSNPNFME